MSVVYSNQPASSELEEFFVHTIIVETLEGQGANGDVYAAPQYIQGFLEGTTKLVRGADGEQIISDSHFYTYQAYAEMFTPDTRVTIDGRTSHVLSVNVNDSGSMGLPDHAVIYLK